MKNPSPHYPLVYIEWHDAVSNAGGWRTAINAKAWANPDDLVVHQIGWLIEKKKTHYLIASRLSPENKDYSEQYGQLQMVPKTWAKIVVLAPPSKK